MKIKRSITDFNTVLVKRHSGGFRNMTFRYGLLLLFLGFLNPEIPQLMSNVCPGHTVMKFSPVDILNVNDSFSKGFNVKQDSPDKPLNKKHHANSTTSQPLSDQCYFKVGHRLIADRAPESALLASTGIFLGYPCNAKQFLYPLPFVIFSSIYGNSSKIRPPPEI
jgi:hypothetical protein